MSSRPVAVGPAGTSPRSDAPVVVVGGGVVGLCIAYFLASADVPVEVIEGAAAGSGASWGNAGWVCSSHSIPVSEPGVAGYALRSLGRPDSPLYLNLRSDPRLLGWLWRFWRSSGRSQFLAGYQAMADFNRPTFGLFEELAAAGVETTLRRPGLVHAFLSVQAAEHTLALQRVMAEGRYTLPEHITTGSAAVEVDPALASTVQASYLVEGEGVVDPDVLVAGLLRAVRARGGVVHEQSEATGFVRAGQQVDRVLTTNGEVAASAVVIAAGTASGQLLQKLARRLPLQAGKGYSFSVDLAQAPTHPLYLADKRMVTSPINGSTRMAGTMEFTGHNRELDWRRIVAIARASRAYLGPWFRSPDELMARIRDPWVGGRPMLPDGLPVIDRLPDLANAYVATGHGMLGVTYGPATGRAMCDYLLRGQRPAVLEPFSFDRLGR